MPIPPDSEELTSRQSGVADAEAITMRWPVGPGDRGAGAGKAG